MVTRELVDGEVEASRQKGIDSALKIVASFREDLSTDQKLETLCQKFRMCADVCLRPMLDNFDPRAFFERGNYKKEQDLKVMLLGSFKASSQMEEIVRQMDIIGRGKMNGHTRPYLLQREECDDVRYRLQIAKDLYLRNRAPGGISLRDSLTLMTFTVADRARNIFNRYTPSLRAQ